MMKRILLVVVLLCLLTGCKSRDEDYYMDYADIVVSFFRTDTYDVDKVFSEDVAALDKYLSRLTHINESIDVKDYYTGDSSNSSNKLTYENGTCIVNYADVKAVFDKKMKENEHTEISYVASCNGKEVVIYPEDLYPDYEVTKKDPKYDYVLLKNEKVDGNYVFYYRSSYDGTGLKVTLVMDGKNVSEIVTEFVSINNDVQ